MKQSHLFIALTMSLLSVLTIGCAGLLSTEEEVKISKVDSLRNTLDYASVYEKLDWLAAVIAQDSISDSLDPAYPFLYLEILANTNVDFQPDSLYRYGELADWCKNYIIVHDTVQAYPSAVKYSLIIGGKVHGYERMMSYREEQDLKFNEYLKAGVHPDSGLYMSFVHSYRSGEFEEAIRQIQELGEVDSIATSANYWYNQGYAYKESYKYNRAIKRGAMHRKLAIQSFKRASDISAESDSSMYKNSIKALKYLAATAYNNAAMALEHYDIDNAFSLFDDYLYLSREVFFSDTVELNNRLIEINLFAASKVVQFIEYLPRHDTSLAKQADSLYQNVLAIDKRNLSANYNAYKLQIADNEFRGHLIAKGNSEQKVLKMEAKQKNVQLLAASTGIVLLLLLVGISFLAYNQKKKDNALIEAQKQEVESAHEQLEEKNKEITDSIIYAKRIQEAILPPLKLVKENLEESFILYKPKDIVAGDFYWMETVGETVIFAAADCTGHGVPGAMVSVVCSNALNRSVREFGLTEPAKILDKTLEIVIERFEKSEEEVKDGMDIALCALNTKTKELQYAGANNPLWIVSKKAQLADGSEAKGQEPDANGLFLHETKATKQPIGKYSDPKPYENHAFRLNEGDSIYIFSDGYPDQFGGEKGKKLKTRAFKELLLSIQDESMDAQKKTIDDYFETWRGSNEQIDDVCVIGVRL